MSSASASLSARQDAAASQPVALGTSVLPRVVAIATGGTIAGRSASSIDTTDYKAGEASGRELIDAVPEIAAIAQVEVVQFSNFASTELTNAALLELRAVVQRYLSDETVAGVIITHGTSTTEETAIFLNLTITGDKPVVIVGAMRPGTAVSADGPLNLIQAVSLAVCPQAKGRGVMIVSSDRIGSAMFTSKAHTQSPDAFRAYDAGNIGIFVGATPRFFFEAAPVIGMPKFDIGAMQSLPRVDILYSHQDEDPTFIDYAISVGAKGIVIAGTGNSTVSKAMERRIVAAMEAGVPVVRASHVGAGFVSAKKEGIASGFYNPQKARILLTLAIASGASVEAIKRYFIAD